MQGTLFAKSISLSNSQIFFRLAWLLLAVTATAIQIAAAPLILDRQPDLGWVGWSAVDSLEAWTELGLDLQAVAGVMNQVNVIFPIFYISFALFIFWQKPSEKVAVLIASFLLLFSTGGSLSDLSVYRPELKVAGHVVDVAVTIVSGLAFFLFPDGKFKPRWTRWAALLLVAVQIGRLFNPVMYQSLFAVMGVPIFLLPAAAQFQRYRRHSNSPQQRQVKWVIFSFVSFAAALGLYLLVMFSVPALQEPTPAGVITFLAGNALWYSFMAFFPLSLLIAMFKSHLWDIDLVIRKTLIYSLVTILLGAVYLGGVTVLQTVFSAASGQSSPASIVLSTLAIAALFNPLRGRIQEIIDLRFYRQKYNAEQTLLQFAHQASRETDLDEFTGRLINVVHETVRPVSISIWFMEKQSRGRE